MPINLSKLHNLAGAVREKASAPAKHVRPKWYDMRNVSSDRAVVHIYDMIGEDPWTGQGVGARAFADELRGITSPTIELHINSEGGEVFDGVAIYESLKQHPAQVEVCIDSLAASAASFIAMAGDKISMARNGRLMIHDAAIGGAYGAGNAAAMREFQTEVGKLADLLDDLSDNIADIYAQRAGGTVESWRALMQKETWFSASQAKEIGLIDEIMGETQTPTTPVESPTTTENAVDMSAFLAILQGAWNG